MEESRDNCHVRLRRLARSFKEGARLHRVLNSVDAEFLKGEAVALRGRSGSGKSTLLNLISGIDKPDDGEVVIDSVTITALAERERTLYRRKHIGFVYQAFNLVPTLSVADNVRLVLELNGAGKHEASARVREMLEAVGLADRAGSFPDLLSGGEQQRVAIARALAHRPALLLADEPTGNLDDTSAELVLELLGSLVRETGGTMLIATHSSTVASICHRSIELRDGRLLGDTGAH
jgi:putative ABC transport system ATP-binding protein